MMNTSNKIGLIIFIGLIVLNMITYKSCTRYKGKCDLLKKENKDFIAKCDSILALPADTIVSPPVIVKGKDSIIYRTKWRDKPVEGAKEYRDSISNDSIDLKLKIYANELYSIDYTYKPIYTYQEKIVEKRIPYPVDVFKEVEVYQRGLFFNAGLGYSDEFSAKVGLMYLTSNQNTYSYDIVRYGNKNIHLLSFGIKF